jgi:hypothetical protein
LIPDTSGASITVSSNTGEVTIAPRNKAADLLPCEFPAVFIFASSDVPVLAGDGGRLLDGNDVTKWQSDGDGGSHWFQLQLPSEVQSIEAFEFRLAKVGVLSRACPVIDLSAWCVAGSGSELSTSQPGSPGA